MILSNFLDLFWTEQVYGIYLMTSATAQRNVRAAYFAKKLVSTSVDNNIECSAAVMLVSYSPPQK